MYLFDYYRVPLPYSLLNTGICMVFEGDDGGDGDNKDGGGGGGSGDSKDGEGNKDGDNKDGGDKKDTKPAPITVKVNGEEKIVTIEELKAGYTKTAGADAKFREASELAKKGDKGVRVQELFGKIVSAEGYSEEDLSELAGLCNVDKGAVLTMLGKENKGDGDAQGTGGDAMSKQIQDQVQKQVADNPIIKASQQRQYEDAVVETKKFCREHIDKDEILGKMIIGIKDSEQKEKFTSTVTESVFKEVQRKIYAGEKFGAEMIEECVQSARAQVSAYGIPAMAAQKPIVIGLGPSEELSAEIQSDEPVKRVPVSDDNYDTMFMKKYFQNAVKYKKDNAG